MSLPGGGVVGAPSSTDSRAPTQWTQRTNADAATIPQPWFFRGHTPGYIRAVPDASDTICARSYVACTRPDPTRTFKISYRVQPRGVSHTVQFRQLRRASRHTQKYRRSARDGKECLSS